MNEKRKRKIIKIAKSFLMFLIDILWHPYLIILDVFIFFVTEFDVLSPQSALVDFCVAEGQEALLL